jgi:serine-type D-Ala-D-Ala carboxypeptidase (penicillin-binding protein 5/6)
MRSRLATAFVLLALVLATSGSAPRGAAAEVARFVPPPPPAVTADAIYVVDATSDTELFAVNADEPLPPASLTKIVSALVVLDLADLEDIIEIAPEDLVDPEQSQVGLVAGDRLSAGDLLIGMLVPSGNDATLTMARHLGQQALGADTAPAEAVGWFVEKMNEKATALGATNSHFENPTGIDAGGHVMSARDVAVLTEFALEQPLFAEIVAKTSAVLASEQRPEGYPVSTTNDLLVEGLATGVKTGTTPEAGGCLATSFDVGPNAVIAVVLGSDLTETAEGGQDNSARYDDTRSLMEAVNADYVWLDPSSPGVVDGLPEELLVWDVALASEGLQPVPAAEIANLRYRLILGPPADPAAPVGEVLFFVGDRLLAGRAAVQAG